MLLTLARHEDLVSTFKTLIFLSSITGVVLYFLTFDSYKKEPPVPPGPKPFPFIGNLLQLPRARGSDLSRLYMQWSKIYGDVFYMKVFGREFVILNSLEAATDLFEKRSAKYSSKPNLVMAGEMMGMHFTSMLFSKYSPKLKQCRKLVHRWINPRSVADLSLDQQVSSIKLLKKLVDSPELFSEHIRSSAGAIILKLTYGINVQPSDDPYIQMAEEITEFRSTAMMPGKWLVDSFPFLKYIPSWFPGAGFKTFADESRRKNSTYIKLPYELVKAQLNQGIARKSWVGDQLVSSAELGQSDEDALICAAGSMYAGGIDTITSFLRTFFLLMARHPEVQKKAQAEIDSIIGSDQRMPTIADKSSLPYVECLIKETLRINPIGPLVPHSLDEDDIYNGWRIPSGAWIIANTRAILQNPNTYKNPEEFMPERFDSRSGIPEPDLTDVAFGFGRRFCAGFDFAHPLLFTYVSQILYIFNISPSINGRGERVKPPLTFDIIHFSAPKPFQCEITPRDNQKIRVLETAISSLDE